MERTSRLLCGPSGSSRTGSTWTLGLVSSALTETGPDLAVDLRLLLLVGCFAGGVEVECFDADGLSVLRMGCCQRVHGAFYDED
jgi:hypothetical protein